MRAEVRRLTHGGALRLLKERWRNPIQATVTADGSFNNWPRLPVSVAGLRS